MLINNNSEKFKTSLYLKKRIKATVYISKMNVLSNIESGINKYLNRVYKVCSCPEDLIQEIAHINTFTFEYFYFEENK